jgi:hypothetical protein
MIKDEYSDADTDAILWVRKNSSGLNDGLLRINGALAGLSSNASIAIDDLVAGNITITVKAVSTAALTPKSYHHDIQRIISGSPSTRVEGTFEVTGDIVRAIS